MTRSLHTGRGIKKARLEKRALRLQRTANKRYDAREVIGHRKIGLLFRIVPDVDESLHPIIQEVLNAAKVYDVDYNYRAYWSGKTTRRTDEELRELFTKSYRRHEIIINAETFSELSSQAKSLMKQRRNIFFNSFTGRANVVIKYALPKKYWKFIELPKTRKVYLNSSQDGELIKVRRMLWDEAEHRHIDRNYKRAYYLRPYKRENKNWKDYIVEEI